MNRYRPARAAWIAAADGEQRVVYAAALPHGRPLILADSAALIWLALLEFTAPASAREVAEVLAAEHGLKCADILDDVSSFLEALRDRGLATH